MKLIDRYRRWRWKKTIRQVVEEDLRRVEVEDFSTVVKSVAPALPQDPVESKEMGTATAVYKNVASMVQELIESKKKAAQAAQRITNSIGAPPELAKKTK